MKNKIKSLASQTQTYVLLILIAYMIFLAFKAPQFYTIANLLDFVKSTSWMLVFGMGAMVVLISGGFDVSFTSNAVCAAYITGMTMVRNKIDNLWFALVMCILIGAIFGAMNGIIVHLYKIPPFIATLGTKTVFVGIMSLVVGVSSLEPDECPTTLTAFGKTKLFTATAENGTQYGLSVMIIPMIIVIVLTWFIIYRTKIGRGIVAVGNSEDAAKRTGFNLLSVHMFVYMYIGACAGLAGLMSLAEVSYIAPLSSQLLSMQFNIIAAIIIGGTSINGGKGTIFGSIIGILLIRIFNNTLIFIGLSSSWNDFFVGLVLIVCMTITSLQNYKLRRSKLLFTD